MVKKMLETSIAIAEVVKNIKPDVIPAYPITPQTHIIEHLSELINDGELDSKMLYVESEHSALSALLGAGLGGARTFTSTSSQGLFLMYEILPIVSGMNIPSVMVVANRSVSAPLSIWNDHSDTISARDQGWIQIYCESAQEVVDEIIKAYKLSEHSEIQTPVMVNIDGFTLTHLYEPVDIPSSSEIKKFLPSYKPSVFMDSANPKSFGNVGVPGVYMDFKLQRHLDCLKAIDIIPQIEDEFEKQFKRRYGNGLVEGYKMEDAEYAVMMMGSTIGTARVVVDNLRKKGKKVGIVKLRTYRPFPYDAIDELTKKLKGLAVIDRHISTGYRGPVFTDYKASTKHSFPILSYIAGLGGREISQKHIERIFEELEKKKERGDWLL